MSSVIIYFSPFQGVTLPAGHQPLTLSPDDVYAGLSRINPRKAAGPDGVPGRVYRAWSEQLTEVWTDIFKLSLAQGVVPECLESTT